MSIEEYNKLCRQLGLTQYSDIETSDYGFRLNYYWFFSVCGYRQYKDLDNNWPPESIVIFDENGDWTGEYFTKIEEAKERIIQNTVPIKKRMFEIKKTLLKQDFE